MIHRISSLLLIMVSFFILSCKKAEDRTCFKSNGSYNELIIPLDSIRHFNLGKNIKYRFYQDNQNKVIVKGGENLIKEIEIDNRDNVLYVDNRNRCKVLRNQDEIVEVEIHYPYYKTLFVDATDSVIFEGKIKTYSFGVEMRNGGGSLVADVDVHKISMVVSHGAADFTLKGRADEAELKIQNNGAANAVGFLSKYIFIYQNSTADLHINLDKSSALIIIDGTGDVYYKNNAGNIEKEGVGQGKIIKL